MTKKFHFADSDTELKQEPAPPQRKQTEQGVISKSQTMPQNSSAGNL
jgi:hypothetical protein